MYNIVLVTSVIYVSENPLSYVDVRSIYNSETRIEQTLNTIISIKKTIPNYYIVMIEGSKLSKDLKERFIKEVNEFIDVADYKNVNKAINGPSKGLGEVELLLAYLESDSYTNIKINAKSVSKMSGRYMLDNRFSFDNSDNIICRVDKNMIQISTIYYKIPIDYINSFIDYLKYLKTIKNFCDGCECIEVRLFEWIIQKNYKHIEILGVSGNIAVSGDIIDI
jgi:hypothetical protein